MVKVEEYEEELTVAGYEVNADTRMRMSFLLRMCQEISNRHLSKLGLAGEKLWKDGIVFLIMSTKVTVHKMPVLGDKIRLVTHPLGTAGVQFYRDYTFYVNGEEAVSVIQTSVTVDPQTHKIFRPKQFLAYNVFHDGTIPKEKLIGRMKLPEEDLPLLGERPVWFSDLDWNQHVNNSIYADIVMDFLPGGIQGNIIQEFQIQYITESVLGDTLKIYGAEQPDGTILLYGKNERGVGFATQTRVKCAD